MADPARNEIATNGILRAGLNLGNRLLVTGRDGQDRPTGVAPDMAAALADKLSLDVRYVGYASPADLAAAAERDEWDVALIGAEPQRAATIDFTSAYCEIEASYLVPPGSPLVSIEDVDRPGVRIAVFGRGAYGLWLERNVRHAELVRATSGPDAFDLFVNEKLDALAGLRSGLCEDSKRLAGARVLPGHFMSVQQAIGVPRGRPAALAFLQGFVEEALATGLVASLIERHGVTGRLSAARRDA